MRRWIPRPQAADLPPPPPAPPLSVPPPSAQAPLLRAGRRLSEHVATATAAAVSSPVAEGVAAGFSRVHSARPRRRMQAAATSPLLQEARRVAAWRGRRRTWRGRYRLCPLRTLRTLRTVELVFSELLPSASAPELLPLTFCPLLLATTLSPDHPTPLPHLPPTGGQWRGVGAGKVHDGRRRILCGSRHRRGCTRRWSSMRASRDESVPL